MKRVLLACVIILIFCPFAKAQRQDSLIQLSGFVLSSDSLRAIQYTTIIEMSTGRGTVTDGEGYFSFVTKLGDSIQFTAIGYKRALFYVPQDLKERKYSIIQLMTEDTFFLAETVIHPWPSRDQFDYYFENLDIPDDDLERARKNLERERLRELALNAPMDGRENQKYYMSQQVAKYYYSGQLPPMKIFDPIAWSQFFRAWKRGDFKKKKK